MPVLEYGYMWHARTTANRMNGMGWLFCIHILCRNLEMKREEILSLRSLLYAESPMILTLPRCLGNKNLGDTFMAIAIRVIGLIRTVCHPPFVLPWLLDILRMKLLL